MHFSKFLFTAASLLSLALSTPVPDKTVLTRTAATIQTALVAAGSQAAKLQATFEAATGVANIDTITADNDALLASINAATTVITASAALTVIDVLGLYSTITSLQTQLDDAMQVVIAKAALIASLGYTTLVYNALVTDQAAVDLAGVALIAKVPSSLASLAQSYITDIDESFESAEAAYS